MNRDPGLLEQVLCSLWAMMGISVCKKLGHWRAWLSFIYNDSEVSIESKMIRTELNG